MSIIVYFNFGNKQSNRYSIRNQNDSTVGAVPAPVVALAGSGNPTSDTGHADACERRIVFTEADASGPVVRSLI